MKTYDFELASSKPSIKGRVQMAFLVGGLYCIGMLGIKLLWPSPMDRKDGFSFLLIEAVVMGLMYGATMAFVWPKKGLGCRLLVDDRSMTCVMNFTGIMKWHVVRKTVSAGKVRCIREIPGKLGTPGGCAVSEQTGWKAWMHGGVFISKSLPEYDELKALAESWRAPE